MRGPRRRLPRTGTGRWRSGARRRSSPGAASAIRRAKRSLAPAPAQAPPPARNGRARGSWLAALLAGERGLVDVVPGLLERLCGFRRHVVLVVLGQHLARLEDPVGPDSALRDHPLALAEQVRKDA